MKSKEEIAKDYYYQYVDKYGTDWLSGVPDLVDFLLEYEDYIKDIKQERKEKLNKIKTVFPSDAHSFEVFAIKDTENFDKEAFIGFKIQNDFHFISVPCTIPLTPQEIRLNKLKKLNK